MTGAEYGHVCPALSEGKAKAGFHGQTFPEPALKKTTFPRQQPFCPYKGHCFPSRASCLTHSALGCTLDFTRWLGGLEELTHIRRLELKLSLFYMLQNSEISCPFGHVLSSGFIIKDQRTKKLGHFLLQSLISLDNYALPSYTPALPVGNRAKPSIRGHGDYRKPPLRIRAMALGSQPL